MSEHERDTSDRNEIREGGELLSAASLRRRALQEERLAEIADLPRVREKHRMAARSWTAIARSVERVERLSGAPEVALTN